MTAAALRRIVSCALASLVCAPLSVAFAERSLPTTLDQRARGADRVVVATVAETTARYRENAHGDRLIVTRARLSVESHWKGAPVNTLEVDVEGGTVDGITMGVSDLPKVEPGERGIFFLSARPDGSFVPHLRGHGVLKLDQQNKVRGTRLSLEDARRITMQEP